MRTLKDINFKNQRAIVRVDFNVPLNEDLQVTDITRIKAAKPTIDYILSKGGSCVLLSHLGRPNGFEQSLSFQNIIDKISEIFIDNSSDVSLGGILKGNIKSDKIRIKSTADVDGVLNQKNLSIEDGAKLKIKAETYKFKISIRLPY